MKREVLEKYIFIFWVFILGSFFGFIHENFLNLIKGIHEVRRGLIYEPLIPIYGIGLLIFYLVYHKVDLKKYNLLHKVFIIFIIGFISGGVMEYLCSLIQEKVFGTISWDYSYLKYNINGRTSLLHASFWGLLGILFYQLILPILSEQKKLINKNWLKIFTIIIAIIFILDCSISWMACQRETERRKNIEPRNTLEKVLDKYYPDEYLDRIYNNAQVIK